MDSKYRESDEAKGDEKALDKHRIMQESLGEVGLEINKLDDLIDVITGTNKEVEADKKEKSIFPLGAFLVEGNSAIVNIRERISKINIALRELLF